MKRCLSVALNLCIILGMFSTVAALPLLPPCTNISIVRQEFLNDNNQPVNYLLPNENFNIFLEANTNGPVPCSARFIVALYNNENMLQKLKIEDQTIKYGDNWLKLSIELPSDTRGLYVKVYCFEPNNSLKPLIVPITFKHNTESKILILPSCDQSSNIWKFKMTILNFTNKVVNIDRPVIGFEILDINRNDILHLPSNSPSLSTITLNPGEKFDYIENLDSYAYEDILYYAMYVNAYIYYYPSSDFTIEPNEYEIMIYGMPRPMKPNIYLYPEKEQTISVKVEPSGYISKSIPYYSDGWSYNVTPDGKIDGKYDFLFYEAVLNSTFTFDKGWLLDKNNFESSMDDILTRIGLTDKEKQDFLDYWTTALEWQKQYYAVYLVSDDEINSAIPLTITPKPDSLLRTFFYFIPMDEKINIEEPTIQKFERSGFSAVEWGGMKE